MNIQPYERAGIVLGAIILEDRDISLGQCRLSCLMAAAGQNPSDLIRYYIVHSLYFVDKNGLLTFENDEQERSRITTLRTGYQYLDASREIAHMVAKKMKEHGVSAYEVLNGKWVKKGKVEDTFSVPYEGGLIGRLPPEAVALFRVTLEEQLGQP